MIWLSSLVSCFGAGLVEAGVAFPAPQFSFGRTEALDVDSDVTTDQPWAPSVLPPSLPPSLPPPPATAHHSVIYVDQVADSDNDTSSTLSCDTTPEFVLSLLDHITTRLPPDPSAPPADCIHPTVSLAEIQQGGYGYHCDMISEAAATDGLYTHHLHCVTHSETLRDWPRWARQWYKDGNLFRRRLIPKHFPRTTWDWYEEKLVDGFLAGNLDERGLPRGAWFAYDGETPASEDTPEDYGHDDKDEYPHTRLRVPRDDSDTYLIENKASVGCCHWVGLRTPMAHLADGVPQLTLTLPDDEATYHLDDPLDYGHDDNYQGWIISRRLEQMERRERLRKRKATQIRWSRKLDWLHKLWQASRHFMTRLLALGD
ncbi:hypothetical protein MKZ38_010296 [Zalerion maritima]|uniref:Uncharacterized protein n=1 Tax=Zalerion maritima TaxID=339359 RepID=A0AAD5WU89_9PEZI|nr:hypothetical protein MKZ38_010296 [Zalerion maritima]